MKDLYEQLNMETISARAHLQHAVERGESIDPRWVWLLEAIENPLTPIQNPTERALYFFDVIQRISGALDIGLIIVDDPVSELALHSLMSVGYDYYLNQRTANSGGVVLLGNEIASPSLQKAFQLMEEWNCDVQKDQDVREFFNGLAYVILRAMALQRIECETVSIERLLMLLLSFGLQKIPAVPPKPIKRRKSMR